MQNSLRHTKKLIVSSTGKMPYVGRGGRAGVPENREAFADAFVPPSQLAEDTQSVPSQTWQAIDDLAERGLRLERTERYATSPQWRDAANHAWEAVRLPMHRTPLERIGSVVADWFERYAKPE